ncbi:ricin-type beta-trefoil lectin domain protein [Marinomonas sp. 5E14-1]|uniref:ricin-type beta-trefoil lectin domain protein n=1 Tax=Marinomonas sp. 5E14-1 TaxID=3153922 RepID=UPI0032660BC9
MKHVFPSVTVALMAFLAVFAIQANAKAPVLKAGSPIIYLADNLDEDQQLGWCIDTVGAGFNEKMHAHSCKTETENKTDPRANDIKFAYNDVTGQIESKIFENKCMDFSEPTSKKTPFGLLDCSSSETQKFSFDEMKGQISLSSDPLLCVAVAQTSKKAGPFMSRDLITEKCDAVDSVYLTWKTK